MTQDEIKEQIDSNNEMIRNMMNPTSFVLNNVVAELLKENARLQMQCQHKFIDGKCIYCYKEAEDFWE